MESMFGSRRRSKKGDSSTVLMIQGQLFFPSSSRTFRTQSYWSFITGQCCGSEQILPIHLPFCMCVQSSFCHQLWTNTRRSKLEQETDRQYSSRLLILGTKVTRILTRLTWMYHVVHNICTMHGRDIKTRYMVWTSILRFRMDWNSIRLDGMQSSFKKHSQPCCIPKVKRMETGEVLYDKEYMSPRPPPKISLKHEWTRELGSKVARQPEGEVARQAKIFQPTQPIPNPIRDRSGRLDDMQDGRNTSRSQEINVNSFNEELSSSDRTGGTVETEVIRTRSSEDSKSLNVEQTHDRTERPVATLHTAEAQDSSRARSAHESDTLNVDDEVLRKRMENPLLIMTRIMNQWWWTRQTWTPEFQDYHIPLWNTRKVQAFDKWFRKLRTTQLDMLFKKIYDRINHLIISVQNQNKWFGMCVTSNYVKYSRRNPKRSAYWNIGIFYCICEHFLHKERGATQQFINYTMDYLSVPEYVIKKGRPHGNRYGKKPRDKEYHTAIDDGMLLRMKIIPTIWLHKNTLSLRVTGGFIRTSKVPILCQWRTDLTSNRHCLSCNNWNKKQKEPHNCPRILTEINNGHRVLLLRHGGIGKVHGGLLIFINVTMEINQVLIERCNLLNSIWNNISGQDFLEFNFFVTDGSFTAKHNTSNDMFSRCKSVQ